MTKITLSIFSFMRPFIKLALIIFPLIIITSHIAKADKAYKNPRQKTKTSVNISVSGKVVDSLGNPLAGATIKVKGTSISTSTDIKGIFNLTNVAEDASLIVTYVGYKSKEIGLLNNHSPITIVLFESNINGLKEVVISTGYQHLKPYQVTGAASYLSGKDYHEHVAVTGNFLENLEGKIAGLVYNPQTGLFSIRGVSTFRADLMPLIIVDGFPTDIDIRTIDPNNIVSVTVLKDAAAAAIYGSKASNGVIVLETRRGKIGKTVVNAKITTAIQAQPDFGYLKYAPANEFALLEAAQITATNGVSALRDANINDGMPLDAVQNILVNQGSQTAEQVNKQIAAIGAYDNLKEYENLFYQTRQTNNIDLDISGGSDKSTYLLGFNYIGDKLVQRRSNNKQYLANLANTYQLNSRMKLDFKSTYSNATKVSGNTPDYTSFLPYEHLADAAGNPLPVTFGGNYGVMNYNSNSITPENNAKQMALGLYDARYFPYQELTANTNTTQTTSVQFQGILNTRITNWLNLDIGGTYQNQNAQANNLQTDQALYTRLLLDESATEDPITGQPLFTNVPKGDILSRNSTTTMSYTIRAQLNLNKSFGRNKDHSLTGILGVEQRKKTNDEYSNAYFGYDEQTLVNKPINMLYLDNSGNYSSPFPGFGNFYPAVERSQGYFNHDEIDTRFMSYYGNGTYNYKNKYTATGSLRLDKSNLFGSDPQYRNKPFGSAGLAWTASKEDFLSIYSWINELKLRASYGTTGNVPPNNGGKFLSLRATTNTYMPMPLASYEVNNPQNQALRWEITQNYNFGLDYALFNNRLSGSIDYYVKNSINLLGNYKADPTVGFDNYTANTASILNKGLELQINTINIKNGKFAWETAFTGSFNTNKIKAVNSNPYYISESYMERINLVGKPLNPVFSYNYGGLTDQGQPYVLTKSGAKVILAGPGGDVTQNDLIYNGTMTPNYVIGLNNHFTIDSFNLSFMFMYYGGNVTRVQPPMPMDISQGKPLAGASNYWKKPGDELTTLIPAIQDPSAVNFSSYATDGYIFASNFVRRADYIKLQNVALTYNLKINTLKKIGVTNTQFSFQAQNVFVYTFSGNDINPEAIDPITGTRSLPIKPLYSLSLSCTF
jgi:TonB-linked SusC/RagA family outer membrane protein